MIISTIIFIVISTILYKKWHDRRFNDLIEKLPSPIKSRIPFVGHIYLLTQQLQKIKKDGKIGEAFFQFNSRLANQFRSEGICAVDLGPIAGVHVPIFKASLMKDILSDAKNLKKSPTYHVGIDYVGNDNLVLSYGDEWRASRRIINPAFHFSVLETFTCTFNKCADEFCNKVKDKIIPDVQKIISHYLLKSLMETSLGFEVGRGDKTIDEYLENLEIYQECIGERLSNIFLQSDLIYNLSATGKRAKRALKPMHEFSSNAIRKRSDYLKTINADNHTDKRKSCLVDTLIIENMKNPTLFTSDFIRNQIDTFTFAGHDTVSMSLKNALFQIAINPEVQKKIHEEIDNNLSIEEIKFIRSEVTNKLTYLDAVIKESMRMIPAINFIGRTITSEIKIGDYTLPVGCYPLLNLYDLGRDPEQFKDPDTFNPGRFLPDNEENQKRHPFAFLPFSAGLRNCIGQKFAINELKTFLIKILYHFKISTTIKMEDIRLIQGLSLHMSETIDMNFERRR